MMELKVCALVVTLISSVIANPYGYGVKGGAGASAKAVAGASAGVFGGDPSIPVPFGNGYSGSFTKSSSSSSSSSSASSSSSSSSFAYNGYVPGGIVGLGSTGNIGCTSGLCQNSGTKDISGNLGVTGVSAGGQGYNTANAAAVGSGANCQGPACISNSEKCLSGQCATNPQIETLPLGNNANKKCASGPCDDSLDDIHVVGHTSNTAYGSKDQSAGDYKASDYSSNSNCHGYSCGTPTTFGSQPESAHQARNLPGKQLPATSNYGASNGYKSPSIHLETPKEESICESGDCNTDYSRPSYDNSLSSYNVPIHGAYDSNKQKSQCQDGKCDNSQKGSYSNGGNSLPNNYLNSQVSQSTTGSYYPSSPSCSGPNCGPVPYDYVGVKPTSASNDNHFPLRSPNTDSTKCNSPNCNPHSVGPTAFNVQPGYTNYAIPIKTISKSNQKVPVYTSGFGAPGGNLPVNPSYIHPSTTLSKEPTIGSPVTGCDSPNCLGQAPSPVSNQQPTVSVNKPQEDSKSPIYSSGFGAPAGLLKPNDYTIPASGTSKPIQPVSTIHNTPSSHTTGCNTGNCFENSNIAGTTSTTAAQSGSFDNHKEIESGNTYTGGFGGPTGCKTGKCFGTSNIAGSTSTTATQSGSTSNHKENESDVTYAGGFGGPTGSNSQVGSYAGSKQNLPAYTSGFGAPPGLLNPYDASIPAGSLKPNEHNKPAAAAASPGCASSYCSPKPTLSSSSSHNLATSLSSSHASASSSASASAVAYTGGFGGPPGVLKPYDNDKTYVGKNYGKSQANSPLDSKPGTYSTGSLYNAGSTSQIGGQTNFGALAGSTAGAYSGSVVGSNVGPYGYSQHASHPAENGVKTAAPCGEGCGGYQDSVTGSGSSAAAAAKSLSSSGSYGFGGSFAGSSSSAHSSAGSYTKGGYGKR